MHAPPSNSPHDPYAALRLRDFRLYLGGNVLSILGLQMQTVAVGWEIYERTGSALALAGVGLVQVLPVLTLALFAGHVADRVDRKQIVTVALVAIALASLGLAAASYLAAPLWVMYGCLLANGIARAFQQPAKSALLPQIVPREAFANAVTWSMSGFQLAAVIGPALGGMVIAVTHRAAPAFLLDAVAATAFCILLQGVRHRPTVTRESAHHQETTFRTLTAGIGFVFSQQVLLGAMALDMFAVLLGGATTLLPIYAKDILQVGPQGLGWMQAAPAIGALLMSFVLAHRPPMQHAGRALLLAVAGFGLATIVFGLSRSYVLSLSMLFLLGALDNISVVVRHTLAQLLTPDAMRGRVSAINGVFISASNELGGFESGVVAHLFGPVISVVGGGVGTLLVVALVAGWLPQLRRFGRLDSGAIEAAIEPEEPPTLIEQPVPEIG